MYRAFENRFPQSVSPDFNFNNSFTRGPLDNSAGSPIGQHLASMMFGVPAGSMSIAGSSALQSQYFGLYLHDDFKLARNFTLNVGLRYEKETPITERYDRLVSQFDNSVSNPIEAQAQANYAANPIPELPPDQFRVLGGLTYVGSGDRKPYKTESNNLLPRLGFSWQVAQNTILRGGYGIFYDLVGVNRTETLQTGFSQSTPIQATLDSGLTYLATNANPFPNGLLQPLGPAGGLTTNLNQGFEAYPTIRRNGYAQRFSFGLQQQLGPFLLETTYVGNRATRLAILRGINNTPLEYLSTSPVRDNATNAFLSQQFPSPFRGTDPIYGNNISRANLLRPYPHFGGINMEESTGYSWYHSLQTRVEKRFAKGYTFQAAYTYSKTMEAIQFLNAADPKPYETISQLDRPHRLAMSGIYEFPFGRGRRFGASLPGAVDFIVGGWQLNGIVTLQSGQALNFGNVLFIGNTDDIKLPASERTAEQWFNTASGFNRVANQQLVNNVRTFPFRFSGLRGDAQTRWDLSAIKNFRIYERAVMQFRAECFNALNQTVFNNPNTGPTSTAFGTITGTQAQARTFQFALKLQF